MVLDQAYLVLDQVCPYPHDRTMAESFLVLIYGLPFIHKWIGTMGVPCSQVDRYYNIAPRLSQLARISLAPD